MFDKQMKEALESQKIPFNEHAWEQMSARLDKVLPVQKNGLPWKSILGASAVVVTAAALYFANTEQVAPTLTASNHKENAIKESKEQGLQQNSGTIQVNDRLASDVEASEKNPSSSIDNSIAEEGNLLQNVRIEPSKPAISPVVYRDNNPGIKLIEPNKNNNETLQALTTKTELSAHYTFDLLTTYCENQALVIDNPYGQSFKLVSDDGSAVIPVKGSLQIKQLKPGHYSIYQGSDKVQSFDVQAIDRSNKVNIVEDYHFIKGIPQITVQPTTQNQILSWSVNGVKMQGNEYAFNTFTKGEYEVTFKANGSMGCPEEYSTKVFVAENYNLLAPNAFNVNSMDQRNRRFIPFALTQRDTPFELIIIEPASGRVVYRTNTTAGWDGIDQGTGELVPSNKPYVWKVTLSQPVKGEKKEYSSVVTRVD